MIRVLVVEDYHIIRQGICNILSNVNDIQIVGDTDNGVDALKLIQEFHPDVIVLDISMPQMDGIDVLKHLNESQVKTRVVVLSIHADLALVQKSLELGALGYVLKQTVSEELIDAIRAANRGSSYLSSGVSQILTSFSQKSKNPLERLSPRECEVTKMIVAGRSTKEIAYNLHTSVKTIEKQRRDAMRKLNVENIASLVRVYLELEQSN